MELLDIDDFQPFKITIGPLPTSTNVSMDCSSHKDYQKLLTTLSQMSEIELADKLLSLKNRLWVGEILECAKKK